MEKNATQQALQAGASPLVLSLAKKMLGKKEYIGYCQRFVERMGGTTQGVSAIDAWNRSQNKVQGTQGIQSGDLVYFSPNQSNQGYGHTGVYEGDNNFISATYGGVQRSNLADWAKQTAQKILGYVPQSERTQQVEKIQPQKQQVQRQQLITPQFTPVQVQTAAPIAMPNPIQQSQDTTRYGRITVPNLL